jgi:hypothetical protein
MSARTLTRRQALWMMTTLGMAMLGGHTSSMAAASCTAPVDDPEWLANVKAIVPPEMLANPRDPALARVASLVARGDRATLQQFIAGDYARGRVVAISGWWISRTEARLLAAVALHC